MQRHRQALAVLHGTNWNSEEEEGQGQLSLSAERPPGSTPHWATVELGSRKGTHPPVALSFYKTRVRVGLQVVASSLGQAPALQGGIWEHQLLALSEYIV